MTGTAPVQTGSRLNLYRKWYERIYTVLDMAHSRRRACACVLILALSGCGGTPPAPAYVTPPPIEIPAECEARCPAEPKLPKQDITDLGAAKDRLALKAWGRCERHYRATCAARLKVLLPKE